MFNIRTYLLLPFVVCFLSCRQKAIQYVAGSLDQAFAAAEKADKKLLVMAYMPGCESCSEFGNALDGYKEDKSLLTDNYLIYKCPLNQIGNEYIAQVAYNVASPTCYIFNSKGLLQKAIMGNKGIKYLMGILSSTADSSITDKADFRIGLIGQNYIDFVNTLLQGRQMIEKNKAGLSEIKTYLQKLEPEILNNPYFYNNYLAAKIYAKLGDNTKAKQYATNALAYDNDFSLFLYQELRKEMKFLTGEQSIITRSEAVLSFEKTSIDLGTTPLKSRPKAIFSFKNTGRQPLIVKNVQGSCDCMDIKWPAAPVLPGAKGNIEVVYRGDHEGAYSKLLFVSSNAANEQEKITLTGIIK